MNLKTLVQQQETFIQQQNENFSQLTNLTGILINYLGKKECPSPHKRPPSHRDNTMLDRVIDNEDKKLPPLTEGSLFQRKNGRREARIMIDGKQKYVACCQNKNDAYKRLKSGYH